MKKIQFICGCFALFLVSCGGDASKPATTEAAPAEKTTSSMAQKNLDAMHAVDKAFETGDASGLDSVIAPNFVDHTDKGDKNRDTLKAMIKMWHDADKTMKMETLKEVADDDYVFSQTHVSGTGDGVMMPKGPYDMHSVEVVKFKDGKAVEHWGYMEMGEVSKMMEKMMGDMKAPPKKK